MIGRLQAFGLFLYDFLVGDDWQVTLGVVVAMALTALVAGLGAAAWWVVPVALVVLLPYSLWRAVRR